MKKCHWCEEKITSGISGQRGSFFCDDLCERLSNDYWTSRGPSNRPGNQERTKRELTQKKNEVRSGGR